SDAVADGDHAISGVVDS
uniref:Septenin 1a n=1 Tax=Osteopilus septentrionalis TaxID=317373 RepID=SEP1A_OSTSE|nr:RecName: Full=Septenin 1a [Osteopilus septentrionalis]